MKKVLLAAATLLLSANLFAQSNSIPNPGFENWTVIPYQDPVNCQSSNDQNVQNQLPVNEFRVTDAYHGKYAVQLKSMKAQGDTLSAYFAIGDIGNTNTGGSAITGTPTGVRVYYKYTITSSDTAILIVELKKSGTVINQYFYEITDTTSTYKLFSQAFTPAPSSTPDSIIIGVASSSRVLYSHNGSTGWAPNSIFQVDSMTFTGIPLQPKNFDGDFENWTNDTAYLLQGWSLNESGSGLPVRTTDAFAGKYAVQLTTQLSNCNSCSSQVSAMEITSGKVVHNSQPIGGLPYGLNKDTLEFFYKYAAKNNPNDTADVELQFHRGGSSQNFEIKLDTASYYKKVDFPFNIFSFTPDSVLINIYSSFCQNCSGNLPTGDVGSTLKVDSMHFKSQLPVTVLPANPAFCLGTGGVKITASGATTYTWSPSNGLSATTGASVTANPLGTQTYTVTGTTGSLSGTQIVTVTVNHPPTVTINPPSPSLCTGNSINLTASGASVSYIWRPAKGLNDTTTATVSANPTVTTTYSVIGTSAAGCTGANSVTLNVTTTPTVTVTPSVVVVCSGGGSTVLKANGATSYTWKPAGSLTASTGANVIATPTATTTYTVIGSNGSCTDSATVTVTIDAPMKLNTTAINVTCNGMCNGGGGVSLSGGTTPYMYSWNTTPPQTGSTATSLCAGNYTVTVTDGVGCTATGTVAVTQPQPLNVNASQVATTCGDANGVGVSNPTGGTSPYTYLWNTTPAQTSQNVTGLASGNYQVVVTDANKCMDSAKITVGASSAPAITVKVTPSNCGTHNGVATASVSGGVSPYKYSWNNGGTTATVDSLAAGVYIITVTDSKNCSSFLAVTVGDTNGPSLSITSVTQNKCYGQTNGAVSVTASGGKSPYRYTWSTGATTTSISNLPAGPYQITVTDATGCSDVKTVNITAPNAINLSTNTVLAACKLSDGSASVTATGGTSPYTYNWSTGATTTSIANVAAGVYTVTVIDNNGCKDSAQASVSNAAGPVVTVASIFNDSCTAAGNSGAIVISDSGGTKPYTYSWSNGATTSAISTLAAGSYAVTVTDAAGCIGTAHATVAPVQPAQISICMVTVNPANNQNQVVWNKSLSKRIAQYNIYKETTSPGVFGLIGSVKADSTCIFNDTLSNALVRSWRYEISQVDSCGNESPLSLPHKTMHLTVNGTTTVNLIWDNYQGLNFNYYIVYRDSIPGVASDSINYVTNNGTYTFSDTPPFSTKHLWYYHMGISNPGGCFPAIEAVNYNASKSNSVAFNGSLGLPQVDAELNSLELFPNPSTGMVNMSIALDGGSQNISIKVINTMGQTVWSNNYENASGNFKKQLDFSLYAKGIYIVQVTTNNSSIYRKVVIQ